MKCRRTYHPSKRGAKMAWINEQGYVERYHGPTRHAGRRPRNASSRNWWLVKSHREDLRSQLEISIQIPARYYGKRIRLKVELVGEDER